MLQLWGVLAKVISEGSDVELSKDKIFSLDWWWTRRRLRWGARKECVEAWKDSSKNNETNREGALEGVGEQ